MMEMEAVRRLLAYRKGQPLRSGEKKSFFIANDVDIMIVAFLRMGGESRPWGIAFGRPGKTPNVLSVPEARNRDLVAQMAVNFAEPLLCFLRHPDHVHPTPDDWGDLKPLRQIWLPNDTHLDMLHHLAYAYARTRFGGTHRPLLNAFGRALGWLFREAQRPGQMAVLTATNVLRESYTFPSEDIRQQHLAYLLSWLQTKGSYEKRLHAAMEAEQQSIATSLDPEIERAILFPLVQKWGELEKGGDRRLREKVATRIHENLANELRRRWGLVEQTLKWMRSDSRPPNAGLSTLVDETIKEQWSQFIRMELKRDDEDDGPAIFPSNETDRDPRAAAARYLVHVASAELVAGLLVHDDQKLLADAIANGDAFRGKILAVKEEGNRRKKQPVWTIEDAAARQLRLRVGGRVSAVGFSKRMGTIRSIDERPNGTLAIRIELIENKTHRPDGPGIHGCDPMSSKIIGHEVAFVAASSDGISRSKCRRIWNTDGPGTWLTHSSPHHGIFTVGDDDDDDAKTKRSI